MRRKFIEELSENYRNSQANGFDLVRAECDATMLGGTVCTFKRLITPLQKNAMKPSAFTQAIPNQQTEDKLFSCLDITPDLIKYYVLFPFLALEDIFNLSSCSRTLCKQTTNIAYWKDKLMDLFFARGRIEKAMKAGVIQDYKKLYRNISQLKVNARERLFSWELLCLSGDIPAIDYAIQKERISASTKGLYGRNPLHYAALSGSDEAMKHVFNELRIPADSRTDDGATVLHDAALGGSIKAMECAVKTLNISANSCTRDGATVLHFAACGGSVMAIQYASEVLKLPVDSLDKDGTSMLYCAARSGSLEAIKYAVEIMKQSMTPVDMFMGTLHNKHRNILHYAALSGSSKAVLYVRQLIYDFGLPLEPTAKDHRGCDAFRYAGKSPHPEEVIKALALPKEKIGLFAEGKKQDDEKPGQKKEGSQQGQELWKNNCLIF